MAIGDITLFHGDSHEVIERANTLTETRSTGVYLPMQISIVSGSDQSTLQELRKFRDSASEILFSQLTPQRRVVWLYKNDFAKLLFLLGCSIVGLHIVAMSVAIVGPYFLRLVSWAALADESGTISRVIPTPELFQWYIGGLLGVLLLGALGVWMISATKSKSDQGYELAKTVAGFAIGFIAGKPFK